MLVANIHFIDRRKQYLILAIALIATFLSLLFLQNRVLQTTHGIFMYPLDDPFIHLELAKNLAQQRTWGINPNEFSSASSSILYTLLLALFIKLFSAHVLLPFVMNAIAGVVLIVVLQHWLTRQNISAAGQIIILLCVVFFTPLPIVIMSGMEHTFQCLFVFLFITSATEWMERLEKGKEIRNGVPWKVLAYGALVTAIRFEGLFLIAVLCLLLLFRKRVAAAFILGAVSVLPVVLFGIISLLKGSYFLPNSVIVKSEGASLSLTGIFYFLGNILVEKLTFAKAGITAIATQRLLLLLPAAYLIFHTIIRQRPAYRFFLVTVFAVTVLHLSLAATGWFYRYEAYLVLCSVMILGTLAFKGGKDFFHGRLNDVKVLVFALLFLLLFPLVLRSAAAFSKASQACINIYEQQYQMGQFAKRFYNNAVVAANDIGAVSYYTQSPVLDLWGLGNFQVAKSKKEHRWTPGFLDSLARQKGATIAIVYDSWFDPQLLHRWQKVATWKIPNNVICGDDTVSFYAVDASAAGMLLNNLKAYQPTLPQDVERHYY